MKNLKIAQINRDHIEVKLKLYDRHGVATTYLKGTIKRFMSKLRSSSAVRFNVLVTYGKHKDVFGDTVMFTNEYDGESKKEAIQALQAFLE